MTFKQKFQIILSLEKGKIALEKVMESDKQRENIAHLALMEDWRREVINTISIVENMNTSY